MFDKRKYTRRNDTLLKLWLPNIYVIPHMDQECTPDLLKDLKVYLSIGWQVLGEKRIMVQKVTIISWEKLRSVNNCEFFHLLKEDLGEDSCCINFNPYMIIKNTKQIPS